VDDTQKKQLSFKENLGYFLAASFEVYATFVNGFLIVFMTDIIGTPAWIAGAIFLACRLFDAINDPMMGLLADATKPRKIGKYRLWLFIGAPLTWLFSSFCFVAIGGSVTRSSVFCGLMYLGYGVAATIYQVPYGAMLPAMTTNPGERATLGSLREFCSGIIAVILSAVIVPVILYFGNGEMNAAGYRNSAFLFCFIGFVLLWIGALLLKERNIVTSSAKFSLKRQMHAFTQNKYLICLILALFFAMLGSISKTVFAAYFGRHYLQNTRLISTLLSSHSIMTVLLLPTVPLLLKKFQKKTLMVIGLVCSVLSGIVLIFAQKDITLIVTGYLLGGVQRAYLIAVIWAVLPDLIDYSEWKVGIRANGLVFALAPFVIKAASAIMTQMTGIVLSSLGYVGTQPVQAESVQVGIYWANCLIPLIFASIALLLLVFGYKYTPEMARQVANELPEKRRLAGISVQAQG
jgi:sugar (glycoside-pentoside-hexuronide) transporter